MFSKISINRKASNIAHGTELDTCVHISVWREVIREIATHTTHNTKHTTHNTQPTTLTTHSLHRTVIHQRVSAVQLTQCRLREEAVEAAQVEVADLTLAIGACDEGRGRWCE